MDLDTWVSLAVLIGSLGSFALFITHRLDKNHAEAKADHEKAMTAIDQLSTKVEKNHEKALAAVSDLRTEMLTAINNVRTETLTAVDTARAETLTAAGDVRAEAREDNRTFRAEVGARLNRIDDHLARLYEILLHRNHPSDTAHSS